MITRYLRLLFSVCICVLLSTSYVNAAMSSESTANAQEPVTTQPAGGFFQGILNVFFPEAIHYSSVHIARSIETTFDYISDLSHAPTWDPQAISAQKTSDGDVGLHSEFVMVGGLEFLPIFRLPYKIVQYERPRRVVFEGSTAFFSYRDTLTFSSEIFGTRLDYRAEIYFNGILRFLNPLLNIFWQGIGNNATKGMPEALVNNTPAENTIEQQIADLQEMLILQNSVAVSDNEKAFLNEIFQLANDIDGYFVGVDTFEPGSEAAYQHLINNMQQRFATVEQKARLHYELSELAWLIDLEPRILLAQNAFLLMSYRAFTKQFPDFYWTKLGNFVANVVREQLVLAFSAKELLDAAYFVLPPEFEFVDLSKLAFDTSKLTVEAQLNVLSDIGALALMNDKYGPDEMFAQDWLTPEAKGAFDLQRSAQRAKLANDMEMYRHWRTEAAILFGAHEQTYILQDLWDQPVLKLFSALNESIVNITKTELSLVSYDFYLGANKFLEGFIAPVISPPGHATSFFSVDDRIALAKNGFLTLAQLEQDPILGLWIEEKQEELGLGENLYTPAGLRWLPGVP